MEQRKIKMNFDMQSNKINQTIHILLKTQVQFITANTRLKEWILGYIHVPCDCKKIPLFYIVLIVSVLLTHGSYEPRWFTLSMRKNSKFRISL
jgi:hypothetical protein